MPKVKALTICQPYAHLIAVGEKPIENRSWPTQYRGQLLIHAGKSKSWMEPGDDERYQGMVFGALVGRVELVACLSAQYPADPYNWPARWRHLADHEHANGPFCWVLEDFRPLRRPVYCRGAQGLWVPFDDTMRAVREAS